MAILSMQGIDKSFHGVRVLRQISLTVYASEVHALVGENGAGKSTLMKILSGALQPDGGTIEFEGSRIKPSSPSEAQALGIAMIHQELLLAPSLSAAENILLGRLPTKAGIIVDQRKLRAEAQEHLAALGADIDPSVRVDRLTVAQRQQVAIARALATDARVIIMDEPSAVLTEVELERLFSVIDRLTKREVAIVYISHRLEEVFQLSSRVTILRDGQSQGTFETETLTRDDVVRRMVGRDIAQRTDKRHGTDEVVLRATDIHSGRRVRGCSLKLHRGEVLGLAGLVGAGRTELARAIVGADRMEEGAIELEGRPFAPKSPADAIQRGLAYVSEDRKGAGIFPSLGTVDNVLVPAFRGARCGWIFLRRWAKAVVDGLVRALDIRAADLEQPVITLSGGNQQKVVLARWLNRGARVLILDEPTRGIDVLAKDHIYGLMRDLVEDGAAILMISSELPELLAISDRILTMHEGRIVGELACEEATEERVLALCMGHG